MPSVSVVIPTWNRAALVVQAVTSALAQTAGVTEVLVCDDGSDDNTRELVLSMPESRVRWIEGPHAGRPAVPRNRGIAAATGDWIAFLDSDDAWLPDKLAKQFAALEKSSAPACCTNAWRLVPGRGRVSPYLSIDTDRLTLADLLRTNQVICSSALVHRSVLERTGGFPEDESLMAIEDYGLWLRVAAFAGFSYVGEPLLDYRDAPAASLRADTKEAAQREAVMLDCYRWARRWPLPAAQLRAIRKATRRAMRRNGRSIVSRMTFALGGD